MVCVFIPQQHPGKAMRLPIVKRGQAAFTAMTWACHPGVGSSSRRGLVTPAQAGVSTHDVRIHLIITPLQCVEIAVFAAMTREGPQ